MGIDNSHNGVSAVPVVSTVSKDTDEGDFVAVVVTLSQGVVAVFTADFIAYFTRWCSIPSEGFTSSVDG